MKKIVLINIICFVSFVIVATATVFADTDGSVSTNPYFGWGIGTNSGSVNATITGSYNLVGETAEGRATVEGFAFGKTDLGIVNNDGFTSNSSFGFVEITGLVERVSGTGPLTLGVSGNLNNCSIIGNTDNGATACHSTVLNGSSTTTEGASLGGDLRVFGFSSVSEKTGDFSSVQVGQFRTELTGTMPASARAMGAVQTNAEKSAGGVVSSSHTNTISGINIQTGEWAGAFGVSEAYASENPDGNWGKAAAHSWTKTGPVEP